VLQPYRQAATDRWEKEIQSLEARNESEVLPTDGILFIGSSSIRRWHDIAVDMAPYRTIQRGYGGAKYSDLAVYAQRLIQPHRYRALVVFVGNDVSGKETDQTPAQVEQLVRYVVGVSHAHQPGAPVFLIEVTPTEKRWEVWDRIRDVNARLREVALSTADTYFIPTASHFLLPSGTPRVELFVEDKLHLSEQGYDVWSELIRRRLDDVLRTMTELGAVAKESSAAEK
jgi:lysophospholipase L1-like esterase